MTLQKLHMRLTVQKIRKNIGNTIQYFTLSRTDTPDSGWADRDRLNSFAFSLDMNMDEFNECMDSSKYKQRVKANYDDAVKNGVTQTPTFILVSSDGKTKKLGGAQPYSVFAATIESML